MKVKALIANDDMDVHQLMHDLIEINYRDAVIERAMSPQGFWAKAAAAASAGSGYHLIFLSLEYIKEEPEGFIDRLKEVDPSAPGKVIVVGEEADFETCGETVKKLPFLAKPFSLERFEEVVRAVHA